MQKELIVGLERRLTKDGKMGIGRFSHADAEFRAQVGHAVTCLDGSPQHGANLCASRDGPRSRAV